MLDHVDPHAHGGASEADNLVVSCQPCNYGKGGSSIQQLGLSDPRRRASCVDEWDGLLRVLPLRQKTSIGEFGSTFSVADRRHLDAFVTVVESCDDLGVSWALNKVLLVKFPAGDTLLEVLAIEPDTVVQIPWWIGPFKQPFRPFAETLAAAMPDAEVYETAKMWRVRCRGRLPRISELMQDPVAVRDAFDALHRALGHPTSGF